MNKKIIEQKFDFYDKTIIKLLDIINTNRKTIFKIHQDIQEIANHIKENK